MLEDSPPSKPLSTINQMIETASILHGALTIAFIALSVYIVSKHSFFTKSRIPASWIKTGLIIKLIAATSLWWIYSQHYTNRNEADTFRYFDDSKVLFEVLKESPTDYLRMLTGIRADDPELSGYYNEMNYWYDAYSPINDNRAIIRLQAFMRLFSLGSYHVHMTIVCFLSLIGVVAFARGIGRFHPDAEKTIFALYILIPSTCFWGSGLMKDSLAVFALGITVYQLAGIAKNNLWNWKKLAWFMTFLLFLMFVRFQFFLLILPLAVGWILTISFRDPSAKRFLIYVLATCFITIGSWNLFNSKSIQDVLSEKRAAFINLAKDEQAHSIFSTEQLQTGFPAIVFEAGEGLLNSITKPMQFGDQLLMTISSFENALLLLSISLLSIGIFRRKGKEFSMVLALYLAFAISYLTVAGMVTPVAGALVRYKSIVLPMIIGPLMILANFQIGGTQWKRFFKKG